MCKDEKSKWRQTNIVQAMTTRICKICFNISNCVCVCVYLSMCRLWERVCVESFGLVWMYQTEIAYQKDTLKIADGRWLFNSGNQVEMRSCRNGSWCCKLKIRRMVYICNQHTRTNHSTYPPDPKMAKRELNNKIQIEFLFNNRIVFRVAFSFDFGLVLGRAPPNHVVSLSFF